jgi:hypothetical protein
MSCSIIPSVNYITEVKDSDLGRYMPAIVLCVIFYFALTTTMAVSCSLAVNECDRSHIIVQKIMLPNDIDTEIMKEFKEMFTQFKVLKIEFSACGMYRIDLPFLCGIIRATFSYVIIFSQL